MNIGHDVDMPETMMVHLESTGKNISVIKVKGLEALASTLTLLHEKHDKNLTQDHYLLFELKQQQALLRITQLNETYHFFYFDYMQRPITNAIKNVLQIFTSTLPVPVLQLHDLYDDIRPLKLAATKTGMSYPLPRDPLCEGLRLLQRANMHAVKSDMTTPFRLFSPKTEDEPTTPDQNTPTLQK